jgi:hypothetical protein
MAAHSVSGDFDATSQVSPTALSKAATDFPFGSPSDSKGTTNFFKEQETPFTACSNVSTPLCSQLARDEFSIDVSDTYVISPILHTQDNSRAGTGVFLGGRCSVDAVVAFGGVAPPAMGLRSSNRIMNQEDADATQMERAQNLAKAKNAPTFSGISPQSKFSLSSIPDDVFIQRANKLGVSMGTSSSQISNSINNIKEVDYNRTLIMIQKNLAESNKEDEQLHSEVLDHASSISMDLGDDVQLVTDGKEPTREGKTLKVYKRREKVVPKVVRRSVRLSKKYKPSV